MGEEKKVFLDSINDIVNYLNNSGHKHIHYCHYTDISGLKGMLNNKKFHLSRGDTMNDLLECSNQNKWLRTYIASFTHTSLESIAMWSVYSKQFSDTFRIEFRPSKIWQFSKLYFSQRCEKTDDSRKKHILKGRADSINTITIYKVLDNYEYSTYGTAEEIVLCDVSYYTKKMLRHDGNYFAHNNESVMNDPLMIGHIKHVAWEYEKETRLCIILPENSKNEYPEKIAIDIPDFFDGATLMSGPCTSDEKINEALESIKTIDEKKKLLDKLKIVLSDFKNKLYLPAKCRFCQDKHNGCPGQKIQPNQKIQKCTDCLKKRDGFYFQN